MHLFSLHFFSIQLLGRLLPRTSPSISSVPVVAGVSGGGSAARALKLKFDHWQSRWCNGASSWRGYHRFCNNRCKEMSRLRRRLMMLFCRVSAASLRYRLGQYTRDIHRGIRFSGSNINMLYLRTVSLIGSSIRKCPRMLMLILIVLYSLIG